MNIEPVEHIRHSLAHLLGAAVLKLYPTAQITLGPAVDDGFYYDVDLGESKLVEEDLTKLEAVMRNLLPTWDGFVMRVVSADEAREVFAGNQYKLELINEIAEKGEEITLYTSGDFTDLCKGGHVASMKNIDADGFKLSRIAGAYWRGNEKNKMLTRIYGYAFSNKEELDAYLTQQEEARKRDHRKIGAEMKLFTISPLVGSGLPLFQPKGALMRKLIEEYLWELHKDFGYDRVWTPHLAKAELYHTSGHGQHYLDDMFAVHGGTSKEEFYLKPMNCPHHMQLFADNQFSYRDMPVRYFEPATVYRDEKTGQLGGLTRVRAITQDDGHLFCRTTQIHEEFKKIVEIIKQFYTTMGMIEGYKVRLSLRDDDKSKWLGTDAVWEMAEAALKAVCTDQDLPFFIGEGEAAFYGPKLDFMFKDAIGREHQLATIQCDFNLPERFDLSFINEEGKKERPVVIHRAISGSLERFMGVMIEHFAGHFPVWLSPVQVKIVPIGERQAHYSYAVYEKMKASGIRVEIDQTGESLGKKVRLAKTERVPYVLVIGDKEMQSELLALESKDGKKDMVHIDQMIEELKKEISDRV
ncbi:MAG: threonine--tRNA ligase [Patescibacteria group bacterium]